MDWLTSLPSRFILAARLSSAKESGFESWAELVSKEATKNKDDSIESGRATHCCASKLSRALRPLSWAKRMGSISTCSARSITLTRSRVLTQIVEMEEGAAATSGGRSGMTRSSLRPGKPAAMANTTGELQVPSTKRVLGFTQKRSKNQSRRKPLQRDRA